MIRLRNIIKTFFLSILPLSFILDALTLGHWTVEYYFEGTRYESVYVQGFPFPSQGMFTPIQWYNSGDTSVSHPIAALNILITLILATALWFFLRKIKIRSWVYVTVIVISYLFAFVHFMSFNGLFGETREWFSDFHIIGHHFWFFGLNP